MAFLGWLSGRFFKEFGHLIKGQVLRSTHIDNLIERFRIFQRDQAEFGYILDTHKVDWVLPAAEDGGLAGLKDRFADHPRPEFHEGGRAQDGIVHTAGLQDLLTGKLDTDEFHQAFGVGSQDRDEDKMLHTRGFGCVNQASVANLIHAMDIIPGLSRRESVRQVQYLLDALAGLLERFRIAHITLHHLRPQLLQYPGFFRCARHSPHHIALGDQHGDNTVSDPSGCTCYKNHISSLLSKNWWMVTHSAQQASLT